MKFCPSCVILLAVALTLFAPQPLATSLQVIPSYTITWHAECGQITLEGDSELIYDQVVREYLVRAACGYPSRTFRLVSLSHHDLPKRFISGAMQ